MICKIVTHDNHVEIERLISFLHKAESLYSKNPTSKVSYANLLKLFFNKDSIFLSILDNDNTILASASISIDQSYSGFGFLGHYQLPQNLANRSEVKNILFSSVYKYCSDNGISSIVGPINFNTWLTNRFIYPATEEQYYWEPNNPNLYPEDFLDEEFEIDKKYFSYFLPNTSEIDIMEPVHTDVLAQGFKMTPMDITNPEHRKTLYKLNCECFSENYFYSEISFDQYQNSLLKSIEGMDLSLSSFIENSERKWGYIFNIPDKKTIVIKTILVSPLIRATGLGTAMIFETMTRAKIHGFTKITGALIREGNASQRFFKANSSPYQINEYLLFKKVLK